MDRASWHDATATLDDFALITWAAEPARVAAVLPQGVQPIVRRGDAFVSMVCFRTVGFEFGWAPFVRMTAGQVDYRTYVEHEGVTGIWSFGATLASRLVVMPRVMWGMPWQRGRVDIDARWDRERAVAWRAHVELGDRVGDAAHLDGTGTALASLPQFEDPDECSRVIVNPTVGWYSRRCSGLGRYTVAHPPLSLETARVERARCGRFTSLDLVDRDAAPISAGIQRTLAFTVHTPPRRITTGR